MSLPVDMSSSKKDGLSPDNKRQVSVFINKSAKPVKFRDEYINENPSLKDFNEYGFVFALNVVTSLVGIEYHSAILFTIIDERKILEPMVQVGLFPRSDRIKMDSLLGLPRRLFLPYESNVLCFEGFYCENEISEIVEKWTKSLT